jgi:hypothetical protein
MTPERSLQLQVDRRILNPPRTPQLMLQQGSLSPDGSRVAALLANHLGQARVLVFSTADGVLIERQDTTESELQLGCPFRWNSGLTLLPRPGEDCAVAPD